MVKVLFVCMGNICRSPTAQGVFYNLLAENALLDQVSVDSAGTHAYHVGEPPDRRSQAAALARAVDLSNQRARQVVPEDFDTFDYVLAMDRENLDSLNYICPRQHRNKVALFLNYAEKARSREVPDPYYGGERGFEKVLDLVQDASRGLLRHIRATHRI